MKKSKKARKINGKRRARRKSSEHQSKKLEGEALKKVFADAVRSLREGKMARAERQSRRVVNANPEHVDALHILGVVCREQGKFEESVRYLEKSIALNPGFADAHNNLGSAFVGLGRHEEAIQAFEKAIAIKPDYALAHDNLGLSLNAVKRPEAAIESFRLALEIEPARSESQSEIAANSLQICDWSSYTELRNAMIARASKNASGINPFWLHCFTDDPELLHQCARRFAKDQMGNADPVLQTVTRSEDRIRVAYLSADFRDHPVAQQIASVIEGHDRDRFEVIGISFGLDDQSAMRSRLARSFDRFVDVRSQSDHDVAQLVADFKTCIAVDLMGYTADLRPGILARRPAPIQVNYLGYPGTMGADHMDYVVVDEFIVPDGQEAHYSEQLVRLPDSYMVCDREPILEADVLSRSDAGLPDDGFVLCAFNSAYKIVPEIFDTWMRILNSVPASVLWLRSDSEPVKDNLRKEATDWDIDPDRLVFAPRVEFATHMARQKLADLFLDTLPYNAHTTACDALWAGLPVVTCAGRSFAGRVAGSLLRAVGLPELITSSMDEYENLVIKLAQDPDRLAKITGSLALQTASSPLFDKPRFVNNLETAYEIMCRAWAESKPAEPISI